MSEWDEDDQELIDIEAEIKRQTEKAWQLYDGQITSWVPKSLAQDNLDGTFTMPLWLATDKGFV